MCSDTPVGGGLRYASGGGGFTVSDSGFLPCTAFSPMGGWLGKSSVPTWWFPTGMVVGELEFRQIYLQLPYFTSELDECSTHPINQCMHWKNMNNWNRMPDALKEQVFSHPDRLAAKVTGLR